MKKYMLIFGLMFGSIQASSLLYKEQNINKLMVSSNELSIFCRGDNYYLNVPNDYDVRFSNYIRFKFGKREFSFNSVIFKDRNFLLNKDQFRKLAYYISNTDSFNFIVNGSEFVEVRFYTRLSNEELSTFIKKCS